MIDLPTGIDDWNLAISWRDRPADPTVIDVLAFIFDADEQVRADEDFCFSQRAHPSGAVELESPNEALALLRPANLPDQQRRIVFAAAIEGTSTFGDVGPIEMTLRTGSGHPVARSMLDAATAGTALLLDSLYDRAGNWRLRAIGQGYQTSLAGLAVMHGVDIED